MVFFILGLVCLNPVQLQSFASPRSGLSNTTLYEILHINSCQTRYLCKRLLKHTSCNVGDYQNTLLTWPPAEDYSKDTLNLTPVTRNYTLHNTLSLTIHVPMQLVSPLQLDHFDMPLTSLPHTECFNSPLYPLHQFLHPCFCT